jgi:DNA end-binding protein Ku
LQDGQEIPEQDLIRAAEYDGKYIELSNTDIERHTPFERNIAIRQFADQSLIDPLYYDKPYYLIADKGGELGYAIMRRAFEKSGKVAVVTFLFYDKERLGVVSVRDGLLVLQTMRFYDEILPRSELHSPALPQPTPAQVSTAAQLMERYSASLHIEDYHNEQLDFVNELIERKAKGLQPKRQKRIAPDATPADEITDRMETMLDEKPKSLH